MRSEGDDRASRFPLSLPFERLLRTLYHSRLCNIPLFSHPFSFYSVQLGERDGSYLDLAAYRVAGARVTRDQRSGNASRAQTIPKRELTDLPVASCVQKEEGRGRLSDRFTK